MKKIKQARVTWKQFGQIHQSLLGERFEDAGERLAIVTCPWCGAPRALEYFEYMQVLRMDSVACPSCNELYSLRPIASQRSSEKTQSNQSRNLDPNRFDQTVKRPEEGPDATGRRNWGKA